MLEHYYWMFEGMKHKDVYFGVQWCIKVETFQLCVVRYSSISSVHVHWYSIFTAPPVFFMLESTKVSLLGIMRVIRATFGLVLDFFWVDSRPCLEKKEVGNVEYCNSQCTNMASWDQWIWSKISLLSLWYLNVRK